MSSNKTLTYWNNLAIRSWRNDSCRCSFMLNVTCLNKSSILAHFWWFVRGTKIRRSVKVAWIRILSLRKIETDLSMEHSLVSKFNATVTKLFWPSSVLLASAAVRRDFFRFSTFTVSIHWMSINNVGHEEINLAFDVFARVWNINELCKLVFGLLIYWYLCSLELILVEDNLPEVLFLCLTNFCHLRLFYSPLRQALKNELDPSWTLL